ncbi:unnamed protein product [Rhizophagus irregularis]|uniref:Uncharacterized protein n=1 Tax=Rhizophagus irregularis TaxID=588596 RepID=A0A2N1MDN0_9GLOM|nr:hypothetical protein RhiirC2_794373 [Rhizophagus irregularis]CAB4389337.1 unnamed protein product [Rhizophagus irregularis]CAB5343305.1 unnamed protein product [Rhizophagus irregularis]
MSQPNFKVISDSLNALATEVPNLPNIPVFSVMEGLERIAKRVDQTSQRNDEISLRFNHVLTAYEQRTIARAVNTTIHNSQATIEPLLTNDGNLPEDFPRNFLEIEGATEDTIKKLLFVYGQPTDGDVTICKRRLVGYLGIIALYV